MYKRKDPRDTERRCASPPPRQPTLVRGLRKCLERYFADYESKTGTVFLRVSRVIVSSLLILQRAGGDKVR